MRASSGVARRLPDHDGETLLTDVMLSGVRDSADAHYSNITYSATTTIEATRCKIAGKDGGSMYPAGVLFTRVEEGTLRSRGFPPPYR
ncbi:hypothetical protein CAJAP_07930 [Camponotus japonicus]